MVGTRVSAASTARYFVVLGSILLCFIMKRPDMVKSTIFTDSQASKTIHEQVVKHLNPKSLSAKTLYNELHKKFPEIDHITIRYTPKKEAIINVYTKTPMVRINGRYVVTRDGECLDQHSFKAVSYEHLLDVVVRDPFVCAMGYAPYVTQWIQLVPEWVKEGYSIIWENQQEILLDDRFDSRYTLIAAFDTPFTDRMKDAIHDVMEAAKKELKQPPRWYLDLRFDNRIILRKKRGGGNETGTFKT